MSAPTRCPATLRTRAAAAGAVLVAAGLLSGCGASPGHLRDICADVTRGTDELTPIDAARPTSAVGYALQRFALVERAVGTAREAGLPGSDAAALRHDWLDPAVTSLATWSTRLEALRVAADGGDADRVTAALAPALAVGTEGVDTAGLTRLGYGDCATAFTPPTR